MTTAVKYRLLKFFLYREQRYSHFPIDWLKGIFRVKNATCNQPQTPTIVGSWKYPIVLFTFHLCVTYYYYNGAIDNFFAIDDYWFLMLSSGDANTALFGAPTLRLLGNVIFWVNFKLFGFNNSAYNVVSAAIHCVNVMLIYFLLRRLFGEEKMAFLSAAIYATMSVYCDAILYKAAILTLTNLTFYCVVLILYLKGREGGRYYVWSLIVFFFALLNKEEIASIPLVILSIVLIILGDIESWRPALKKVLPYAGLVIAYIATMLLLSQSGILQNEQFERLSEFRVLHSLLGGFSAFFVRPDGALTSQYQYVAYSLLFLALAIAWFVSRKRKMLAFGFSWVFLTFLPQSYSTLSQFNPSYLFNSVSRHLYVPSIGAAIVIAAILLYSFYAERRWTVAASLVLLSGMVIYNAPQAQARSFEWRYEGEAMERFFSVLKSRLPVVEKGAHFTIDQPFAGRSYMFRALRAFYQNDVVFVEDHNMVDPFRVPAFYLIQNRFDQYGEFVIVRIK